MITTVGGRVDSALTHLAAYGLGNIIEDEGADNVFVWWENGQPARANVQGYAGSETHAELVLRHARRHSETQSWVQKKVQRNGRDTGLFSPRIKSAATLAEWRDWQRERQRALDGPELTPLDCRMIGALGEPAYWHWSEKDPQPDKGASRWEMKTRNKGDEFVGNRLSLLAKTVATRSIDQIADGVSGLAVIDECGNNSSDSRSGTGLTPPGPADNALAWCALWGIANLMLVPQSRGYSQSAGTYPRNRVHPVRAALPVITRATTPARWRRLLASPEMDAMLADDTESDRPAWRAWRQQWGVAALYVFPIKHGGSASAPERYLLQGRPWSRDMGSFHD